MPEMQREDANMTKTQPNVGDTVNVAHGWCRVAVVLACEGSRVMTARRVRTNNALDLAIEWQDIATLEDAPRNVSYTSARMPKIARGIETTRIRAHRTVMASLKLKYARSLARLNASRSGAL